MRDHVILGHCLEALRGLPESSVHCVLTSPPGYGLSDPTAPSAHWPEVRLSLVPGEPAIVVASAALALGEEPRVRDYVAHLVEVMREVRRVLRPDGTAWLHVGNPYRPGRDVKRKDLAGVPWRIALALQADGWWVRSEIVWLKPNAIPEPVTDRPTRAHDHMFLLTRSKQYFYDSDAVREPHLCVDPIDHPHGKNLRSVWPIRTGSRQESFQTLPEQVIDRCLRLGAGCAGACPRCGAPLVRKVERRGYGTAGVKLRDVVTLGFVPSCACPREEPVPCVVLDPFAGAGTTLFTAKMLGLDFIGIEIDPIRVERMREKLSAPIENAAQRALFRSVMSDKLVVKEPPGGRDHVGPQDVGLGHGLSDGDVVADDPVPVGDELADEPAIDSVGAVPKDEGLTAITTTDKVADVVQAHVADHDGTAVIDDLDDRA